MTSSREETAARDGEIERDQRRYAGSGPTPPAARIIHEVIREDGEKELRRGAASAAWSGLGAGLSMGFSFLTMGIIASSLPEAHWATLVSSLGYAVGFIVVVLGRQQLFTESTLTAVLPLLVRRDVETGWRLARLWAIVLAANLVGTVLFAWFISRHGLFDASVDAAFRSLAKEAVVAPFWPMMIKAIFAGWLIALIVWLTPGAGHARLMLILVLAYVVGIGGFPHVIAGSVNAAYSAFIGDIGTTAYLWRFLLPSFVGNVIGGVSLVAILNHAPLRDELGAGAQASPRRARGTLRDVAARHRPPDFFEDLCDSRRDHRDFPSCYHW